MITMQQLKRLQAAKQGLWHLVCQYDEIPVTRQVATFSKSNPHVAAYWSALKLYCEALKQRQIERGK